VNFDVHMRFFGVGIRFIFQSEIQNSNYPQRKLLRRANAMLAKFSVSKKGCVGKVQAHIVSFF